MPTCPNCGYKQPSGDKCQKCSSLFSYYSSSELQHGTYREHLPESVAAHQGPSENVAPADGFFIPWRTAYRIASRTCIALLLLVLFLIFHRSTPPPVPLDPQAAASAAVKISQAQSAAQQNQPHQVTLNSLELNSYLNSNLQLQSAPPKSGETPAAATGPASALSPQAGAASEPASAAPNIDDVQSAVKDVQVNLVGDLVKAYVTFDFHGKDMSLELDGHLSSENGYLKFEPTAGQLGSLPLPQSVLDAAVDRLMSSPENREKLRLPPGVNSIKIVDGQVVMN